MRSRWVLLLLLLLPAVVASQVDTKDGTAITTSTTLDGETGIDTADGQAVTAGGGGAPTCSGTTVISDNFDDDDITDWTTSGTISASGGVVGWSLTGAHTAYKNTASYSEMWALYDQTWTWTVWGTGLENSSRGLGAQYWAGANQLGLGGKDVAGTEKFHVGFREGGGAQSSTTSYTIATGVTYTIKLYILQATTTSSNDGILRVWVDGGAFSDQLIYEDTAVDNNERDIDRFTMGSSYSDGVTGSGAFDNLLVCTVEPT